MASPYRSNRQDWIDFLQEDDPVQQRRAEIAQGRTTGLYGLSTPPGMPQTIFDPGVDDLVREAVQDIKALPKVPYPSTAEVMANHPGVAGYQVLTDKEYQNVNKYDMLMRRLQAIQNENPSGYRQSSDAQGVTFGITPEPVRDRSMWGNALGSKAGDGYSPVPPYRHRGFLAPGQPVRNAWDLWMVPFSAVANNMVRPLYDLDKAVTTQPAQLANATGGLSNVVQGKEMNPAWSEEREFSESAGPLSLPMMVGQGNPGATYLRDGGYKGPSGTVEGEEILTEVGYPEHWSRTALGMLLEAPLDFATNSLKLIGKNAAMAMRSTSPVARNAALRGVGSNVAGEMYAPMGMTGILEAAKEMKRRER